MFGPPDSLGPQVAAYLTFWLSPPLVCTADSVSACCCTSYDLVQCRGKGGRGTTRILHCSSACCNMQLHCPLHSYLCLTQLYDHLGLRDAELQIFFTKECATATLHVASLAQANATDITYSLISAGRLQTLWTCMQCKYMEAKQAKTNSDSSRNEELERMLCWWLFLHHHAHTYPSVKGNELSPCKISSQSL